MNNFNESLTRVSRMVGTALVGLSLVTGCGNDPAEMVASARQYIASNDFKAAEIQLKNALQEAPSHAEARFLLGQIRADGGDYAGAVKEFERARGAGYAEDRVVPALALALLKTGAIQRVLDDFSNVQLGNPGGDAALRAVVGDALVAAEKVGAINKALHLIERRGFGVIPEIIHVLVGFHNKTEGF